MACLFCNTTHTVNSAYEDTVFNKKVFSYLKCGNCGLVYISPLPVDADFVEMYPTSYQGELITKPSGSYDWLFKYVDASGKYHTLLDYGCGNGKFVVEAIAKGYEVTGVEFSPSLVTNLNSAVSAATFLTISDFLEQEKRYDIIFLGNVLEHLTNPAEMIAYFKKRLNENGLLILEGPIEENFTLAGVFRRYAFSRRKKAGQKMNHAPRHIFYANYKNQLAVLTAGGFEKLKYTVNEVAWPFPQSIKDCKSKKDYVFYTIAKTSKLIGAIIPKNGNTFFYIGKSIK